VRDWRKLQVGKLTRAERAMRFIETHLLVPEGDLIGRPIVLDIFQEAFFYSVFDNKTVTRRAFLSIARKNSKTATIACLLLVFIAGPEAVENSRLLSGAMSRDQAAEVYNYASKMVQMSEALSKRCRIVPSLKMILGLSKNVEYKAVSADGKTAHGKSPLIAILDEVGQVRGPQSDFVDAITTAQGAYTNAMLFAISTQAANDGDLYSQWLDDAERSKDPRIVCHLYAADKDANVTDRQAWVDANPALGKFRSLIDVEEQSERAARMPSSENTFRNLYLNQRVSTVSPFISRDVWKSCGGKVLDFGDAPVWAGFDLSARTDLTALVIIGRINGVWHTQPYFWTPEKGLFDRAKRDRQPYDAWVKQGYLQTTPGQTVDYEYVAQDVAAIFSGLNVQNIAYDRWRIDIFRKELTNIGVELPLIEFGQGFKDMSGALDTLECELLNGRIAHGNNPVLTMCAANAVIARDAAGNRKLDKAKATGRIDGLVAMAMAFGATLKSNAEAEGDLDGFINNPLAVKY
jgi:phage terminase large subunit-like protein